MRELMKALKPLRKKLLVELGINNLLIAFITCLIVNLILVILSKFIYIDSLQNKMLLISFVSVFIGFIITYIKKPTSLKVAEVGDSLGFKERFITAFELLKSNSKDSVEELQINDALEKAKSTNFKQLYKITIPRKRINTAFLLVVILITAGFIESPFSHNFAQKAETKARIEKEIKKVDALNKNLRQNKAISKKDAADLKKKLNELKRDLKKSDEEGKAINNIQKTQQELKKLSKNSVSSDLKKLGEKLAKNSITRNLGESLQKGDLSNIENQLKEVEKQLQNMSKEDLKKFAEFMKDAADELEKNGELQQALNQYSDTIQNNNLTGLSDQYAKVGSLIEDLASQNAELREAIEKINQTMASSSKSSKSLQQNASQQSQSQGQNPSQSASQNPGQGNGQGQGSGQGQGQGSSSGAGQGQGRGRGHIKNQENVYSRKAQSYQDYEAQSNAGKTNLGTMQQTEQKGFGQKGESLPYEDVYEQYKEEALKTLDEDTIPHGMRELVKEYFSTLE